jgi:uncharacterized spore protein YtfJ
MQAVNGQRSIAEPAEVGQMPEKMVEKLWGAAHVSAVFSEPVVSGAYTVITASEVMAGGGFGFGRGTSSAESEPAEHDGQPRAGGGSGSGGGGGGGSGGRPVAAIVIGPDGVKVRPIVDVTKVALAAMTAWGSIALMMMRMARARKR